MPHSKFLATSKLSSFGNRLENKEKAFWQLWNQYRDDLYRCCFKWMNGNATDAEDALSRAMLKAWHKFREGNDVISNFKAWLTKLTYNLCLDIRREDSKNTNRVESFDALADFCPRELVSQFQTPETAAMVGELETIIHCAIKNLPPRLAEVCFLHIIQDKPYQEIAQQLGISYDNVCKRISQGRTILQKRLKKYLAGVDDSLLNYSPSSDQKRKYRVGITQSDAMIWTSAPTPSFKGINDYFLSYQLTAICIETLPHAWYQSINPLGWS